MFKFFSYSICTIFFSISCFSQTIWKSDGSIIVDGQIKRESYAVRFLKQLKKSDRNWFQATIYQMPVDGYFGEDIFLPGTPLLRVSGMVPGEDYLYSLAKKNGFVNIESLQRYIIGNANPKFLDKIGISENDAQIFVSNLDNIFDLENEENLFLKNSTIDDNKLMVQTQTQIQKNLNKKVETLVFGKIKKQIETKVSQKVSKQVEKQIKNSFENWWSAAFQTLSLSGEIARSND